MQLSLALALLIGVGVLIRSMMFNVDIPIGWSSRDTAVVSVVPPMGMDMSRRLNLSQDIQNELRAMPEVMTVGFVFPIPFSKYAISIGSRGTPIYKTSPSNKFNMTPEGRIVGDFEAYSVEVSPNGFDVLGIPFVVGRSFTDSDLANLRERERNSRGMTFTRMAIINQAFARRFWPDENPIGKVFYGTGNTYEVVGVARNYHHIPGNRDFIPAMYTPYLGRTTNANTIGSLDIMVKLRPNISIQNFHSNVRQQLSGFPLDWVEVQPLNGYVKEAMANQRLTLNLLIGFAVLGIVVSSLAVYATATLAAEARTKETGIRMAMGAHKWEILRLAFWRGIRAILLGLPFGLFMALILSKVLASFLVQVKIGDPITWIICCVILLAIATIAALIPALRTIRVNPLYALRNE